MKLATIHNYIYQQGLASFIFITWAMGIVTYATYQVFSNPEIVNGAVATAYSALLAIPPAAIAFFKWRSER